MGILVSRKGANISIVIFTLVTTYVLIATFPSVRQIHVGRGAVWQQDIGDSLSRRVNVHSSREEH